jgi:hypothetical protein
MLLGTKGAVVVLRHAPETIGRRTSFEESLRFERVHEEIYRNFGFEFVPIIPGSVSDSVDAITRSAPAYNLRSQSARPRRLRRAGFYRCAVSGSASRCVRGWTVKENSTS